MYAEYILRGMSKAPFEIPHKISDPYIERCGFYSVEKIDELLDLRAQRRFSNGPQAVKVIDYPGSSGDYICKWVQVFSLILDSSVGLSGAFSLLANWCLGPRVQILHSAEEHNLSPFDLNIACLCQSIEINNNKYVCMYVCMYICMYISIYVYISMYVYMYVYIYIYLYLSIYIYIYIYIYYWLHLGGYHKPNHHDYFSFQWRIFPVVHGVFRYTQ